MKRFFYILLFLPLAVNAQHFASCPLDHHFEQQYENPLNESYLSKYDVKFYHLSLEVSNKNTYIEGFTQISLELVQPVDTLVFQFIDQMTVIGVEVNNIEIDTYSHHDDAIFVAFAAAEGEFLSVKILYKGDAGQDRGFFAGITSAWDAVNSQQVTYTLSEPLNARDWFPVKQVLADKADSVWVDLTCSKELMAGSNGLLEEIQDLGNGKHTFKWRSRYPIAYYLISMAVADYRDYSFYAPLAETNDSVLVQNFIYDSDSYFLAWKDRIDDTGDMISLYSDLVIDYPFSSEKYGHCVAPLGGGMEHQTMTTLSNFNFTLVAHELAHQWFGDNITCASWQDIWINEGFASYFEYLALQNLASQEDADNWMSNAMNLAMQENGSVYVPEEEVEDVYRVFDYGLTYKKGATLLHMIRYELDDDALFFNILRSYSEQYKNRVATTEDFRRVLDRISKKDFSCFFDQWYYGKGFPVFYINWYKRNDTLFIESRQETSSDETPLFKTPFDIQIKTLEDADTLRLFQDKQFQVFEIPMTDFVLEVVFDPDKQLLANSNVSMQLPEDKSFVLGPNPFNGYLYLRFLLDPNPGDEPQTVILYNLEGKPVHQENVLTNPYRLNLKGLQDGPYLMVLEGPLGNYQEKIIKASIE